MTEAELKQEIFSNYPDLRNMRPLGWQGGNEIPTSPIVGVAVMPVHRFDGWQHLPVRDMRLREKARAYLRTLGSDRFNSSDDDAVLVLAVIQ